MAIDYRQVAVAAARKYGVDPGVFQRQIQAESGWNPNAVSPAGARGIAQFMPATARGMGVNPADPIQALDGAARLMAQHLRAYKGDYASALAAYNAGPGNVSRWRSIPETRNYVARILGPGGQGAPQGPSVAPPTAGGTAPPQAPSPGGGALNLTRLLALLKADQKDLQAGRLPDRFREIEKAIGPISSPAPPALNSGPGISSPAPGPGQSPYAGTTTGYQGPLAGIPSRPVQFAADPSGGYGWAQDAARRFGLTVTSTHRSPGDQARIYAGTGKRAQFTSRHLTPGAAADISGSPAQMRALAEWAIRSGRYAEVFYDPVGQWDNGRYSPRGIGGHTGHVHLSAGAPLFQPQRYGA